MTEESPAYNRPPDSEIPSDIVHPRFDEIYGELGVLDAEFDFTHTQKMNDYQSEMWMNNDRSLIFSFKKKCPGPFRRFWYWLLLGWRWRNVQ